MSTHLHISVHRFRGVRVLQTFDPMGRIRHYFKEAPGNFTSAGAVGGNPLISEAPLITKLIMQL